MWSGRWCQQSCVLIRGVGVKSVIDNNICKLITADMASKGWPLRTMLYVYYDGGEGGRSSCCGSCWTEASFFFLVCCCVEAFLNILQA